MSIIFDMVLLAILVISAIIGLKRGLIRSVMHFATVIIAIVLAFIFTPKLSPYFYGIIEPAVRNAVSESIERISEESKEKLDIDGLKDTIDDKIGWITDIVGGRDISSLFSDIPEADIEKIEQYISERNESDFGETTDSSEADTLLTPSETGTVSDETKAVFAEYTEKIAKTISEPVSAKLSTAATFVSVFIVSSIALLLLTLLVDLIFKLPLLNDINKTGGLVFGIIIGLFWVYIASLAFSIFMPLFVDNFGGTDVAESFIVNAVTHINVFFSNIIKQ